MRTITSSKVQEICESLKISPNQQVDNSLLNGKMGNAMFYLYASRYFKDKVYEQIGIDTIENIIYEVQDQDMLSGYAEGLTGILWAIKHLVKYKFLPPDFKRIYQGIEEDIYNQTLELIKLDRLDLLHGALGNIYYLFYDLDNNISNKKYLNKIVHILEAKLYSEKERLNWKDCNRSFFDFGVAHGISGLLLVNNLLNRYSNSNEKLIRSKQDIISLILNGYKGTGTLDGLPIGLTGNKMIYGSRYIWCNGPLGILYALSRTIDREDPEYRKLQQIAYNFSNVKEPKAHGIVDTGLCHGTSGNMQICYRFYKSYKNQRFINGRNFWLEHTIKGAKYSDGIAGFKCWNGTEMESDTSLLTGVSGVGLALLSFLDESLSVWDEVFLI